MKSFIFGLLFFLGSLMVWGQNQALKTDYVTYDMNSLSQLIETQKKSLNIGLNSSSSQSTSSLSNLLDLELKYQEPLELDTLLKMMLQGKDRGGGDITKIYGPGSEELFRAYMSLEGKTTLPQIHYRLRQFILNLNNFFSYYSAQDKSSLALDKLTNFMKNRLESQGYPKDSILLSQSGERLSVEQAVNHLKELFTYLQPKMIERLKPFVTYERVINKGLYTIKEQCVDKKGSLVNASALYGGTQTHICLEKSFIEQKHPLSKITGLIFHEYLRHYIKLIPPRLKPFVEEHLFASLVNVLWEDYEEGFFKRAKCLMSYQPTQPWSPWTQEDRLVEFRWQFDAEEKPGFITNYSDFIFKMQKGLDFREELSERKRLRVNRYNDYVVTGTQNRRLECRSYRSQRAPETVAVPYGHYRWDMDEI